MINQAGTRAPFPHDIDIAIELVWEEK